MSITPAITEIHFCSPLKKGTYKTTEQQFSWVNFKYLELSMLSEKIRESVRVNIMGHYADVYLRFLRLLDRHSLLE